MDDKTPAAPNRAGIVILIVFGLLLVGAVVLTSM